MTTRLKRQQAGSMVLEALIGILIFSIGVLGIVAMMTQAVVMVADAQNRSMAGFFANQIIGTMWATSTGTTTATAANAIVAVPDATFACNPCTAATGNGNAYTRAWITNGIANLPQGSASIAINGAAVTITVTWTPPKDAVQHRHVVSAFIG
jgi:type IV pilus assembly protein PilV